MPRYKMLHGERVQFTAEEETARDAEEAAAAANADNIAAKHVRQE